MKIISFVLFCILVIVSGCTSTEAQNVLPPKEFEAGIKNTRPLQLIDVRTKEEFKEGHIRNADNFDYYDTGFRDRIKGLDKSKAVFVYCRSGGRSAKAVQILKEEGFSLVYDLQGGILNWEKENLEIVK